MSKRQRRKVLTEEEYQDNLNQIIQRDYFPDLPALERDVAVYERRTAGDVPGAVEVRRAARRIQAHEEAWQDQEQQEEEATAENGGIRQVARPLQRESLTNFHARATSQDNVEFDQVQSKEQTQRKQELLMLTNGPTACTASGSNGAFSQHQTRHPMLPSAIPLASDQFNPPTPARPSQQSREVENALFFVPEARQKQQTNDTGQQALLLLESMEAKQGAQWRRGDVDNNALAMQQMPPPAKRRANARDKQSLIEYTPTSKMEKKIEPAATRFPKQQHQLVVQRNTTEWDVGSDTTALSSTEGDDTDLDSVVGGRRTPLHVGRTQARKRKEREQETLVQMTPLIVPGGEGRNASPIVTWGTVGATPMVIGQQKEDQDTSNRDWVENSSFRMPELSDREQAAAKAAASLVKRSRRFREAGATASRLDPQVSGLSPAARALLSKSASRPHSVRSARSFGTALRSSYSASRKDSGSRAGSSVARQRDTAYQATPRLNPNDR